MSEAGDAGVLAELLLEDVADLVSGDRLAVAVAGTLGDDHDVGAAPDRPPRLQRVGHRVGPAVLGWALGQEHEVRTRRDATHQGEVSAVAAHHLDDERALVARRRALDRVDRLGDSVQRRVGADRHVGAGHVVVDGADHADQDEASSGLGDLTVEFAAVGQLVEQFGPLGAQLVGTGQAAVATDHRERLDAEFGQVAGSPPASVTLAELLTARRAEHRAAPVQDATDLVGCDPADVVPAVDETLETLVDGIDGEPGADAGADHGAHRRIHSGCVATAGQNGDRGGASR